MSPVRQCACPTACIQNFSPGGYKRWHTVRTRYEDKRTWAARDGPVWGGAHIVLYSDVLLMCACRLDNIFGVTINMYLRAAVHISEQQKIFPAIDEQHYIFQRKRYAHVTVRTR